MRNMYTISEAQSRLSALIREVEQKSVITLTQGGEPLAVLLSIPEYERLTAAKSQFWEAYTAFRADHDLSPLDIQPALFTVRRDRFGQVVDR